MGQYYNAVLKDRDGTLTVYNQQVKFKRGENEYYNGGKLMEHSWWRNEFCNFISSKIMNNPMYVTWVGDYSNESELEDAGLPIKFFDLDTVYGEKVDFDLSSVSFLVNHSKKQYIDLKEYYEKSNVGGWVIYPISLLTSIGNGRGGGDYHDKYPNFSKCGLWAGDLLELTNITAEELSKLGFTKFDVYFKEEVED